MPTLYQLTGAYSEMLNSLANDIESVDTEEMLLHIAEMEGNVKEKFVNTAMFIRNLEAHSENLKEAINSMVERLKANENKTSSLRSNLKAHMEAASLININDNPYIRLRIQKCPPSVEVVSEEAVNDRFFRVETIRKLDKQKLMQELKSGEEIEGAHLIQKTTLVIR